MTEIIGPIKETGADVVPSPSQQVQDFIRASKAESTIRGYRSDWRGFCGWCERIVCARCQRCLKPWRPSSRSVRHG